MDKYPSISSVPANVALQLSNVQGVPSEMALGFIYGLVVASRGYVPLAERSALESGLLNVKKAITNSKIKDTDDARLIIDKIDDTVSFIQKLSDDLPRTTLRLSTKPRPPAPMAQAPKAVPAQATA
jgi:hypothetical protein